jgi:cell division protease FtsH
VIDEYGWALEKIALALLERETMDGEEVHAIIERREKPHSGPGSAVATAAPETQAVISPEPDDRSIGRGFVDGESPAPA